MAAGEIPPTFTSDEIHREYSVPPADQYSQDQSLTTVEGQMLRRPLFLLSSTMALFGVAAAIHGIDTGYAKPLGIGLVMLCGATVFALLFVGARDTGTTRERNQIP